MSNLKLVVFDLDGTLADSANLVGKALNRTLADLALPIVADHLVKQWIGHGTTPLLTSALKYTEQQVDIGISAADVPLEARLARASDYFQRHFEHFCRDENFAYPGAGDLLQSLNEAGIFTALLTNKEARLARPLLRACGVHDYFSACVFGDTLSSKKPSPSGLLHLSDMFKVAPNEMLMVGDSWIDAETAHAANVPVFLLAHGYHTEASPLSACNPTKIVTDLFALADELRKLFPYDFQQAIKVT